MVEEGGVVVGTLPLALAAAVCEKGAEFLCLTMDQVPAEMRGQALSAEDMDNLNATVTPMAVQAVDVTPSSNVICVTRHAGAQEWLARQGITAEVRKHLTLVDISHAPKGTTFIGVLPPAMVAEITANGHQFIALDINVPRELFKVEMTADMMEELGAKLQGYKVAKYGYQAVVANIYDHDGYNTDEGNICHTFDQAEKEIEGLKGKGDSIEETLGGVIRIRIPENF